MTIPHTFATYPAGNFPASDWDGNWGFVAALTNIYCTVGGTGNAIALSTASTSPTITGYQTGMKFTFIATASNSAAVTISVGSLAARNVYDSTGTILASGGIVSGTYYEATFDQALNGAVGGFRISASIIQAFVIPVTPVTKTTLQAAINAVAAVGGGTVQIPPGNWSIDVTAGPITISSGSIIIQGGGADVNTGSILTVANAGNHLFSVTSPRSVSFRDFGINSAVARTAGTAAIYINDSVFGDPLSFKVIERVFINAAADAIFIDNAPQLIIYGCMLTSFTGHGIVITQTDTVDAGSGIITGNKLWDVAGTAGATDGILWHRGSGLRIHNNRFLGAFDYGIHLLFDKTSGDDGALIISNNNFEVQDLYGIFIERSAAAQAAGRKIGQLVIEGNFFQGLTVGYQNEIAIVSSAGGPWVQGCMILGNTVQNSIAALLNTAVIRIDDGDGVTVAYNTIYNVGAGDGGIRTAGNSTNVLVQNNNFLGGTVANHYPAINASTTVTDPVGITFAALPAARNGSSIYVTDGTSGNPVAGAGSGCWALRVNGAWKSEPNTYLASAQRWTGINTFSANAGFGTETNPQASLSVSFNTQTGITDPTGATNSILVIGADNGVGPGMTASGYGTAIPAISLARAKGTAASKTAIQSADTIGSFFGYGYNGTNFVAGAGFFVVAAQTYTGSVNGTHFDSYTTPNGTAVVARAMRVQESGGVSVGATTTLASGDVLANGQFYGPNIATTASAANAFIDTGTTPVGQLKRSTSSVLYKTAIEPLQTPYADAILKLEPIWYRSLCAADRADWSWYGLSAEQVATVDPRLVHWSYQPSDYDERIEETTDTLPNGTEIINKETIRTLKPNAEKKPDGVMYERIPVLLLDVIKRLSARVDELEKRCPSPSS